MMTQTTPNWPHDDDPQWFNAMREQVLPFWQSQVKLHEFTSFDGHKIVYALCVPEGASKLLLISPGRIESAFKYQELIYLLAQQGIATATIDHRGQGLSARLTQNPHQGHVDDFNDFVEDFAYFVAAVSKQVPTLTQYLLSHSMGGAITSLYLANHPEHKIQAAVMSAPMFGIQAGAIPLWLARAVVNIGYKLNQWLARNTPWYFIGMRDYDPDPFEKNRLTHSAARYQWFRQVYQEEPKLQLGGPTFGWLYHATQASEQAISQAKQINIPVTVVNAGGDQVVSKAAQQRFVAQLPHANSHFMSVPEAKHELVMESDRYREPLLQALYLMLKGDA